MTVSVFILVFAALIASFAAAVFLFGPLTDAATASFFPAFLLAALLSFCTALLPISIFVPISILLTVLVLVFIFITIPVTITIPITMFAAPTTAAAMLTVLFVFARSAPTIVNRNSF